MKKLLNHWPWLFVAFALFVLYLLFKTAIGPDFFSKTACVPAFLFWLLFVLSAIVLAGVILLARNPVKPFPMKPETKSRNKKEGVC